MVGIWRKAEGEGCNFGGGVRDTQPLYMEGVSQGSRYVGGQR